MDSQIGASVFVALMRIFEIVVLAICVKVAIGRLSCKERREWFTRYFTVLAVSVVPLILLVCFLSVSTQCFNSAYGASCVSLIASLLSFVLAVSVVLRAEPSVKQRIIMLILMPTVYVFPVVAGLLLFAVLV